MKKSLIALAIMMSAASSAQAHTIGQFYDGMEGGAESPIWLSAQGHFYGIVEDLSANGEICIDAPVYLNTVQELGFFITTVSDIRWNKPHKLDEQIENHLIPQLRVGWPCN